MTVKFSPSVNDGDKFFQTWDNLLMNDTVENAAYSYELDHLKTPWQCLRISTKQEDN